MSGVLFVFNTLSHKHFQWCGNIFKKRGKLSLLSISFNDMIIFKTTLRNFVTIHFTLSLWYVIWLHLLSPLSRPHRDECYRCAFHLARVSIYLFVSGCMLVDFFQQAGTQQLWHQRRMLSQPFELKRLGWLTVRRTIGPTHHPGAGGWAHAWSRIILPSIDISLAYATYLTHLTQTCDTHACMC